MKIVVLILSKKKVAFKRMNNRIVRKNVKMNKNIFVYYFNRKNIRSWLARIQIIKIVDWSELFRRVKGI